MEISISKHYSTYKLDYILSVLKSDKAQVVYSGGVDCVVYQTGLVVYNDQSYSSLSIVAVDIKFPIGDSIVNGLVSHTNIKNQKQSTVDKFFSSTVEMLRS
jgi:hypothetical protein